MDTLLKLTAAELERYAPYQMWSEFTEGFDDYVLGHRAREPINQDSAAAQAYDRGAECAMKRKQASLPRLSFKSAGATRKR